MPRQRHAFKALGLLSAGKRIESRVVDSLSNSLYRVAVKQEILLCQHLLFV